MVSGGDENARVALRSHGPPLSCSAPVVLHLPLSSHTMVFFLLTIRSCVSAEALCNQLPPDIPSQSPLVVALLLGANSRSNKVVRDQLNAVAAVLVDDVTDEMAGLLHEVAVNRVREDLGVDLLVALPLVGEDEPASDVEAR